MFKIFISFDEEIIDVFRMKMTQQIVNYFSHIYSKAVYVAKFIGS